MRAGLPTLTVTLLGYSVWNWSVPSLSVPTLSVPSLSLPFLSCIDCWLRAYVVRSMVSYQPQVCQRWGWDSYLQCCQHCLWRVWHWWKVTVCFLATRTVRSNVWLWAAVNLHLLLPTSYRQPFRKVDSWPSPNNYIIIITACIISAYVFTPGIQLHVMSLIETSPDGALVAISDTCGNVLVYSLSHSEFKVSAITHCRCWYIQILTTCCPLSDAV